MKTLRAFCTLVAMVVFASSATAQEGDTDLEWLMVIQGEVTTVDDGALTMAVPPTAIVFTDRPARQAAVIGLSAFIESAWAGDGTFRTDPPNAALVDETNSTIAIIVITDMQFADGMLTLSVTILEGSLLSSGQTIALTIDAIPTPVNGQITDAVTQANTKVLGDAPAEAMGNVYIPG